MNGLLVMFIAFVVGTLIIGFISWINPNSKVKGENFVIKQWGKKTVIPIRDIQKVEVRDMIRLGYQATIHSNGQQHIVHIGYDAHNLEKKMKAVSSKLQFIEQKFN